MPADKNGGQVVVDILVAAGIDTMFGLEGGHIDPIIHAARDAGMKMVDVRHEAVAGYAADAHVRLGGTPAVAIATAGPGFTNLLTAMASCHLDRTPVLFISGAVPLAEAETNALQGGFDQVAMARPVTKWAERATSIEVLGPMLRAAMAAMLAGPPGPVFLEVPIDVVFAETEDAGPAPQPLPELRPAPAAAAIAAAAELLSAAERPAIVAGSAALLSGCTEELREVAELIGAPVYANVKALGILPGSHPLACGSLATLARTEPRPDAILVLGARNGLFMGGASNDVIPAEAKLVHVDLDPAEIGRIHPVEVPILADCREALGALAQAFGEQPDRSEWAAAASAATGWHRDTYAGVADGGEWIHPYVAASIAAEFVDADTFVVQDGGDTGSWVEIAVGPKAGGPGKYLAGGYLGNLGNHQGMAIAAQLANPASKVICFSGDGSVGFQLQEFDTMVRHGMPIVTVVFNNRTWGMSYEYQVRMPSGLTWVDLGENLRYDLVCEACGGHGELVTTAEQLGPAIGRALAAGVPACVNVLTRSEPSPKSEAYLKADGIEDVTIPYYRVKD
jgi:acetolactate synthase-1/2/3 large subunit